MRNRQRLRMRVLNLSEAECPPGRYRKQHPQDCGVTKCKCCHSEKVFGKRTVKERRADEAFASDLHEVAASAG